MNSVLPLLCTQVLISNHNSWPDTIEDRALCRLSCRRTTSQHNIKTYSNREHYITLILIQNISNSLHLRFHTFKFHSGFFSAPVQRWNKSDVLFDLINWISICTGAERINWIRNQPHITVHN